VSSASVFDTDQHRCLDAGADRFLPKPVDATELYRQVSDLLDLEWIFAESAPTATPVAAPGADPSSSAETEDWRLPSPEVLAELHELAMRGNLRGIVQQTQALQQEDARFTPFANQVQGMARGFQEKELVALLAHYREELLV
jgi:CheY-like chemotaxis protein